MDDIQVRLTYYFYGLCATIKAAPILDGRLIKLPVGDAKFAISGSYPQQVFKTPFDVRRPEITTLKESRRFSSGSYSLDELVRTSMFAEIADWK